MTNMVHPETLTDGVRSLLGVSRFLCFHSRPPPPLGNTSSGIDDGTMGHCSREQAIHLLCSVPFCRRGNRTFPSEGLLQL